MKTPRMTRAHYDLIATSIRAAAESLPLPYDRRVVGIVARGLSTYLAQTNPAFDYDKFLDACTPKGDE